MVNPLDIINNPASLLARDALRSRRAAPEGLAPGEEGPPAYAYPPGYDRLVPIGDTGIYVTPNDPVDPWDCDAWPGSPYCSQAPIVDPLESGYPGAVADLGISPDGCEVCLTITPSILWMQGPPYTICYRSPGPGCREPEEIPIPEDVEEAPAVVPLPVAPPGFCRELWAYEHRQTTIRYTGSSGSTVEDGGYSFRPGVGGGAIVNAGWAGGSGGSNGEQSSNGFARLVSSEILRIGRRNILKETFESGATHYLWRDYPSGGAAPVLPPDPGNIGPNDTAGIGDRPWTLIRDSCNFRPPPPYKPEPQDMGCNCAEIEDLLRDIHNRLGCEQFPVEVPEAIYGNSDKTTKLQDVPNLWAYWFRQMDSLMGQWPIEIEIEDDDPTKEGKQTIKLELPNIAETLAEIFGLTYKIDTTGDLTTEMILRLIPEIIATKNSTLTTQDYAKANASYLGYRGNPVNRRVEYAFDVEEIDSLPGLLKESTKNIQGWQEEDPDTVDAYLKRLMFSAGIIKAALMLSPDNVGRLLDSVDGIFRDELANDENWEVFLRRMEKENDPINKNAIPRPNVRNTQAGGETIADRINNQNP
jgi:hypothetical protein